MPRSPITRHWSTLTLCSVGVCVGAIGFFAGRSTRSESGYIAPHRAGSLHALATQSLRQSTAREIAPVAPPVRWADLVAAARTPAIEQKMLAWLHEFATQDHLGALELAASEPNWRLRALLTNAALQGWATTAPGDATEFALHLPEQDRRAAIAAVFQGAATQPETAARLAAEICAKDPALAEEHGRALIEALSGVGAFDVLARFASADATGHRADWLNASFSKWAERDPAAARQALDALPDPDARAAAFQGLALGWSMAEPRELAAYAVALPEGNDRSLALQQALSQWITRDPNAVADWALRFDPGPDFDLSAATVATQKKLATDQPATALGWAQSIIEPALRNSTLTALARQWAREQPANARRLIAQTEGLLPADREVLLASLNNPDPTQE